MNAKEARQVTDAVNDKSYPTALNSAMGWIALQAAKGGDHAYIFSYEIVTHEVRNRVYDELRRLGFKVSEMGIFGGNGAKVEW
jgi:hypothetical protein